MGIFCFRYNIQNTASDYFQFQSDRVSYKSHATTCGECLCFRPVAPWQTAQGSTSTACQTEAHPSSVQSLWPLHLEVWNVSHLKRWGCLGWKYCSSKVWKLKFGNECERSLWQTLWKGWIENLEIKVTCLFRKDVVKLWNVDNVYGISIHKNELKQRCWEVFWEADLWTMKEFPGSVWLPRRDQWLGTQLQH